MNKSKILTYAIVINLLMVNNFAMCEQIKSVPCKTLKGTVIDSKSEYINNAWWQNFNDSTLNDYINKAAKANHDLKIVSLKVLEAKSLVDESFGKELPAVNLGGNFSRQKTSDNISMGAFHLNSYTQNTYLFPLTASYELDFLLKNRNKTALKVKELEAAQYDEKTAYIALTSAVASAYFNVLKFDKLVELQEEIVKLRNDIFSLTKEKNNYGLCPTTDVIQAEKSLTEAQSALCDVKKYRNIALNQLAVLTGESSDNSASLKRESIESINLFDFPLSVKSETVQKRPDILKAEALLQKSRIDVKIAKKDFFPTISITGQFGFNANELEKVFKWDSYVASVGTGFVQSIFLGGQKKAKLKGSKYRYEQMIENYQKVILQSFQEVNDSLASLKSDYEKNNNNLNRIELEKKNLDLINAKYEEGLMSYLDTLQYKERLLSLQKEQIQSKSDCLIDTLSLYKATGGNNLVKESL